MIRQSGLVTIQVGVVLAVAVGLLACGSSNLAVSDGISSNRINVDELSYPVELISAYDIVRRHKSNWLQKRGRSSIQNSTPVKVYFNSTGSAYGGVKSLQDISGENISTIEYFGPAEAQLKFGLGNGSGAILVRSRSERK